MFITFSIGLIWLGELLAEFVLFVLADYWFLRPFRWLAGATFIMDMVKMLVHGDYALYASLWGFWRIVEVCWLAWIATDLACLLVPWLEHRAVVRVPYAIVVSAAIVNGPPASVDDFYAFQTFGLIIALLLVCLAIALSRVPRFEHLGLLFGGFCALQIAAGEVIISLGYSPRFGQLCWVAGFVLILHAILSFHPELDPVTSTNGLTPRG